MGDQAIIIVFCLFVCSISLVILRNLVTVIQFLQILPNFLVLIGCVYITIKGNVYITGGGIGQISVDRVIAESVFFKYFFVCLILIFGSVVFNLILKVRNSKFDTQPINEMISTRFVKAMLILGFFLIFSFILKFNFLLISRNDYLFVQAGTVFGAIRYLVPMIGVCAIFLLRFSDRNSKYFIVLIFILSLLIEFSASSRSLGILLSSMPLVAIDINRRIRSFALFTLAFSLGMIGLNLALQLRSIEQHGLVPHFHYLLNGGFSLLAPTSATGTFLSIIPVAFIGFSVSTPTSYFLTSFNPLPGSMTNWYQIAPFLNVNRWTPTGSVAQVDNLGAPYVLATWLFVAFITSITSYFLIRFKSSKIVLILVFLCSFNASLQILQYSMRAGVRFLYAGLVFIFAERIYRLFINRN